MKISKESIINTQQNNFNLGEQFFIYLNYWIWFVLSLSIVLPSAFFYLRYSVPVYKSTTTILVKDDKKGGMASELSAFSDLGMLTGAKSNVDNEIEILKSRTLIESTVKELNLNISYYKFGIVKTIEIYKDSPIEIIYSNVTENFYEKTHNYKIKSKSESEFDFYDNNDKFNINDKLCKIKMNIV